MMLKLLKLIFIAAPMYETELLKKWKFYIFIKEFDLSKYIPNAEIAFE